jgi:hypothetical protein
MAMLLSTTSEAKIYRWKDKNGNWVYSGTPKKPEKKISDTLVTSSESKRANKAVVYQAIITSPNHDQTIIEKTGTIYVTGQVVPSFHRGLSVQLFHNGKAVSQKQATTSFVLKSLPHGEHKLTMAVFNTQGKAVAISKEHIFQLHRTNKTNR